MQSKTPRLRKANRSVSLRWEGEIHWRKVYSITVQSLDDAKYNLPGTHLVQRLNIGIVNGGGGSIYSNVPLHDVRVSLVMSDATCSYSPSSFSSNKFIVLSPFWDFIYSYKYKGKSYSQPLNVIRAALRMNFSRKELRLKFEKKNFYLLWNM